MDTENFLEALGLLNVGSYVAFIHTNIRDTHGTYYCLL